MLADDTAVQYTRRFLRSIFAGPTSSMWSRKGTVKGASGRFLNVLWEDMDEAQLIAPEAVQNIPTSYQDDSSDAIELNYERQFGLNSFTKNSRKVGS